MNAETRRKHLAEAIGYLQRAEGVLLYIADYEGEAGDSLVSKAARKVDSAIDYCRRDQDALAKE